jgi:hypothetical protein
MSVVEINGLPLPDALRSAIEEDRWAPPADHLLLTRVFGEEPQGASFYTVEYMRSENRRWPEVESRLPIYLGSPDESAPPGDIDPRMSVLIGDLGYDMPFALDFRPSRVAPRIVYLTLETGRWITVAPTIEALLDRLGLSRGET